MRSQFARELVAQLPALRRYAIGIAGNVNKADDLVQDCIERALQRAASLDEPGKIGGWLRSILHNLYIDDIRRNRRRGATVELGELDNDPSLSVAPQDHSEVNDVLRAMNGLSLDHRQILLLVGVEGLNYREIAEELQIPVGTVMSRLARARERLRSLLEDGENRPAGDQNPGARLRAKE